MRPSGRALHAASPFRPANAPAFARPPAAPGAVLSGAWAEASPATFAFGAALGAALGARRCRRAVLAPVSEEEQGYNGVLDELSQEELLAFELAEADISLDEDEDEIEEWRHYDEEVKQIQDLLDTTGGTLEPSPPSNGATAASENNSAVEEAEEVDAASLEQIQALSRLLLEGAAPQEPGLRHDVPEVPSSALATSPWEPGLTAASGGSRGFALPAEYRQRLAEHEGGVVVSSSLGDMTVVLLSRVPDQPELLPVLSETFRAQHVRILRGWLQTTEGVAMDAFEVCEAATGEALSKPRVEGLEAALVQAVRAPAARQVLAELDGRVPKLGAFFGLPAGAPRCPPMPAARGALMDGPFALGEGRDLCRALVFRVELRGDVAAEEALDECRRRLWKISPEYEGEWECLLVSGISGPLLAVLPAKELEQSMQPAFNPWLVFLLCTGVTAIYAQGATAAASGVLPLVAALLFGILGVAELARRVVARAYGVRLSPPFLFPSPAIGSFGAASRALSVVPSAVALFDLAAAALATALLVSLALIAGGLLVEPGLKSCAWVNPGIFPALLKQVVLFRAESVHGLCAQPPDGSGLMAVPSALVAGCFGAFATALNAVPLSTIETDGRALSAALPWPGVRDAALPWTAFALVACTCVGADSDALVPVFLAFSIFALGARPLLVAEPVLRDTVTQPYDVLRQSVCLVLTLISFALLTSSSVLDLLWVLTSALPVAS